jgi:hypothetical protein
MSRDVIEEIPEAQVKERNDQQSARDIELRAVGCLRFCGCTAGSS